VTASGPKAIGGRYILKRQIGRGGMGAVWLAVDEVLGREVAMKRVGLFPGMRSPDLLRAEREAKLAASLNHPHVVSVFDFVTEGDEQWLVMEYVAGTNLSALAEQQHGLPPGEAAAVLGQVAEALAAAHAAGIVHRDVKPSNILVTADGTAKLADFGIARARADSTLTASGMVAGSPAYLAPEVASGNTATEASDVWSLGATLYHTLTGRPPYDVSGNVLAAMYRIVHEDPPRLTDAGWPADLLETTMVVDPQQRWPMSRVREYLATGSTDAAQPGVPEAVPTAILPVVSPTLGLSGLPSAADYDPDADLEAELKADLEADPEAAQEAERESVPDDTDAFLSADDPRHRWTLPILLGLSLLLIAAVVGWALLQQDPSTTVADDPASTASATLSRGAPTSASPQRSSPPVEIAPPTRTNAAEDDGTKEPSDGGSGGGEVGEDRKSVV
jgi:serine/threonine protein kinase